MTMSGTNKIEINMKKIFIYTSLLAAITLSCSKLENEPVQKGQEPDSDVVMITEKISGGRKVSSKATIDNDHASVFKWSVGDAVAVHVSKGDDHKYVTSSGADVAEPSASFTVTYEEGYARDAFAVYPASIVAESAPNYGQSGSSLDVTLPASYTLDQVTDAKGEKSPCPMIASNTGTRWDFYQLCGLLRLTVNSIPATTKRLEIDFDGKNVAGNFAISSPVKGDGTSTIALSGADGSNSTTITVTKDGTNAVLGSTELVLNIPLPTGNYSNIYVVAYDAISGGKPLKVGNASFDYQAKNTKGVKRTVSLSGDPQSLFSFTFNDGTNDLSNDLRFVRLFSCQNKLYNGSTTYGPYTVSSIVNFDNHVEATLNLDSDNGDQLVFQVVTSEGKVYSGSYDAPDGGFIMGKTYDMTVIVKAYTFSVASSKQVYFSPGDLGVDNGVYSFTEPFTAWNQDQTSMTEKTNNPTTSKRTWFIRSEVQNGQTVYGIDWRIQDYAPEWKYLVGINDGSKRTIDAGNVSLYYKVHINTTELGDRYWCYLLPPDQTTADDIEADLKNYKSGTEYYEVTDYLKYIAKGFVLLMDTEHSYRLSSSSTAKWTYKSRSDKHSGYYQSGYVNTSKTYFDFGANGPNYNAMNNGYEYRIHTRYIHDVN